MDVIDVLGDLLIDLEKTASTPSRKEENKYQGSSVATNKPLIITTNLPSDADYNIFEKNRKHYYMIDGPDRAKAVEPSFLYAPDKDIFTGKPLIRTPSPGGIAPLLSPGLHSPRPGSALSNINEKEVPTFGVNDSNQDFKFQSYHLDYKYTPPPIKGPCCVCGDGIMGAMVTAMDQMWHPEHFCCAHCGIELRTSQYLEHDSKPYCKICHGRLFLPPCSGCGLELAGNYVKAMEKLWHPDCFQCTRCRKVLTPTTFFQKGGKPYCEDDFHDLFSPKCYSCRKPIKDESRKTSVLGRNYHTECFKCCECGCQLTPKNFKEKNGKLYCEKDFNDLFMPKCAGCFTPVISNGVTAMGKNWHPPCFKCTECKKQLQPDRFFENNSLPYCEDDFHKLFSSKCAGCRLPIKDQSKMVNAMGKPWHNKCFNCTECNKNLTPYNFFEKNGLPYCEDDFHKLFSPKCAGCQKPIKDQSKMVNAMGKPWHNKCFNCTECEKILSPDNFFEMKGLPYCEDDFHKLFSAKCAGCLQPIKDQSKMIVAQGKQWHPDHFNCAECGKILSPNNFFEMDGLPYCEDDFHKLFSKKCAGCGQPIKDGKYVYAMDQYYHPDHFTCCQCGKKLGANEFVEKDGRIYCMDDFLNLFAPRCVACKLPIKEEYCLFALDGDFHADCFRCKDCNCRLEEQNFYEIDGEPYCEQHFHARQCPDCVRMRRAQNTYFGLPSTTPMGPSRWASQISLKSVTEETTTKSYPIMIQQKQNNEFNDDMRPSSQLSQYSTTSYDTAYTDGGNNGGRSSPSLRSYIIPIEKDGVTYRNSHGDEGHNCGHDHSHEQYQQSQRSSMKRSQTELSNNGGNNLGKWSNSGSNLQYIARNENPYNSPYFDVGKFPVESKHIRFSDTVTKREFEADGKNY